MRLNVVVSGDNYISSYDKVIIKKLWLYLVYNYNLYPDINFFSIFILV
jgi:hypothetical protein